VSLGDEFCKIQGTGWMYAFNRCLIMLRTNAD